MRGRQEVVRAIPGIGKGGKATWVALLECGHSVVRTGAQPTHAACVWCRLTPPISRAGKRGGAGKTLAGMPMPTRAPVPSLNARLAGRLRQLREDHAFTQTELAARAGISADAVRRLERGAFSPTLRLLTQLGDAFGTTAAEIVDLGGRGPDDRLAGLAALLTARSEDEVALVIRLARAALAGG